MHCSSCGVANPEGAKFCGRCATPLTGRHEEKREKEETENRGNGETGQRQTTSSDASPQTLDPRPSSGERRQLTVMFCDLVGSTRLAEQLDPEELHEVVRAYQETCAAVIQRFEGQIAQYLGDGLLVYFGYPQAHEDDAQRAVRAGLGIVGAIHELPLPHTRLQHPLQVRIGIHTGLVVVGEMGKGERRELLALGEAPNLAARLQEIADPNTVVMSAATYRLAEGFFECRDLGPQRLKGVSAPMPVYRVLGESEVHSRFEVAVQAGLTPLVGRTQEVGFLLERWGQVKEGMGQVVLISGEAGIGKSRLVQVLKEHLAQEPHTWLECRCSPYYQNSALYPVIDLLQRLLQFRRVDSPQEKLRKLEDALEQYDCSLPEVVQLLALLLSLPQPERYPPLDLTPQRQRQKILEAVLGWLLAMTGKQPLLLVGEDLQWVDPTTLELLSLFIDQGPTARLLTVLTFRPEFRPPWTMRSHLTQLTLSRLPRKQIEEMVEKITRGKTLPAQVVRQLVAKADGVPLFVEELTKTVLESGHLIDREDHYELTGLQTGLEDIPVTLQDSLTARLDRLGTVKETAQLGATLGREFPYDLLRAVSPLDEATLQRDLTRLAEAELLYQRGLPPQARYRFKHALIQEAAYQSLLKSTRQQYHRQIAQVLTERFPEMVETQPELLAHHYTQASLNEEAIAYWKRAGKRAVERSANVEAVSHLTKALELLKTLPDTPARAEQELALQIALSAPLMVIKGYGAPETEKTYARARELCQGMGETPRLSSVLLGLAGFYLVRGELQTAHELGEQGLRLAQSIQRRVLLMQAHCVLGLPLLWLGEFASARAHLEQAIGLYDSQQDRSRAVSTGLDTGVVCLSYAAVTLWFLGYPDQALQRSHEALTLAQKLAHPHSLAVAFFFAAWLHQWRREEQGAQERAETVITLSAEQEFLYWLAAGTAMRGWALAMQGREAEGITQIRQGMAAHQAVGAKLNRRSWLTLLAEACGKGEHSEDGLNVLSEALDVENKTEECLYEAELYRLKGELTLQSKVQSPESKKKRSSTFARLSPLPAARERSR